MICFRKQMKVTACNERTSVAALWPEGGWGPPSTPPSSQRSAMALVGIRDGFSPSAPIFWPAEGSATLGSYRSRPLIIPPSPPFHSSSLLFPPKFFLPLLKTLPLIASSILQVTLLSPFFPHSHSQFTYPLSLSFSLRVSLPRLGFPHTSPHEPRDKCLVGSVADNVS